MRGNWTPASQGRSHPQYVWGVRPTPPRPVRVAPVVCTLTPADKYRAPILLSLVEELKNTLVAYDLPVLADLIHVEEHDHYLKGGVTITAESPAGDLLIGLVSKWDSAFPIAQAVPPGAPPPPPRNHDGDIAEIRKDMRYTIESRCCREASDFLEAQFGSLAVERMKESLPTSAEVLRKFYPERYEENQRRLREIYARRGKEPPAERTTPACLPRLPPWLLTQ